MIMYKEYDVVKLRNDRPDDRLTAGVIGAVLIVHDATPPAYLVEFCDQDGMTIALLTLMDIDLEPTDLETKGDKDRKA